MLDLQAIRSRAASRCEASNVANPANWLIEGNQEACARAANPANDPEADASVSQLAKLASIPTSSDARPHALTAADGDLAHAVPWGDREVTAFLDRTWKLQRLGFVEQDADDLAERLALRDVGGDERAACIECRNLSGRRGGFRCGKPSAAGLHGDRTVGTDLATLLQRCPGFVAGRAEP
jgi:hypothetical protein